MGFTSLDTVRQAMRSVRRQGAEQGRMVMFEDKKQTIERIEEEVRGVDWMAHEFRRQQTMLGGEVTSADKQALRERLRRLDDESDHYLASEYGVDSAKPTTRNTDPVKEPDCHKLPGKHDIYQCWLTSHQPFRWFVEFYGIMSKGGFDVVIGNPPYVSKRKIAKSYTPKGFQTEECPDIYATVVERSVNVGRSDGRTSMIVPLSLTFSSGFPSLRTHLHGECDSLWFSSFGRIPSALFSFDTRVRNTIYLARKSSRSPKRSFTTRLHRWFDSQRPTLFDGLSYSPFSPSAFGGLIPKLGSAHLLQGFESLLESSGYRL